VRFKKPVLHCKNYWLMPVFNMKMTKILPVLLIILVVSLVFVPHFVLAQSIGIPCDGTDCDFISIPIAVIGFIYAGFLIMTAGADTGKVSKGKELLLKIAIGFFFVLAAWLIVNLITSTLFIGEGNFNLIIKKL